MIDIYYDSDYGACDFAFDTTRKAGRVAEAVLQGRVPRAQIVAPEKSLDALFYTRRIHNESYVEAVITGYPRDMAEGSGFPWDPGIAKMALAHTRGLLQATSDVLRGAERAGSLSSGLHHASTMEGRGFCTFNGLAAAVALAVDDGAEDILVLDLDAHGGGGTMDIIQRQNWKGVVQMDVTTSPFDTYNPTGEHLFLLSEPDFYLDDVSLVLERATETDWDLVIYNAGMDPFDSGVTPWQLAERELMVADFMADRQGVFALAGGYLSETTFFEGEMMNEGLDWDGLVDLHLLTIEAWANLG